MPRDIQSNVDEFGNPLPSKYSQTQGYGMVPVYAQQGRGSERFDDFGQPLKPVLLGYEFNPIAAGLKREDAPKPPGVLAEEKRLGTTMEPLYQTYTEGGGGRRGGGESMEYGPPIGYRYDNGHSQYVNFDAQGNQTFTQDRNNNDFLKVLALGAGAYFLGPAIGSLFGGGAAGAGTLGAAEGALTASQLASLPGAATGVGTLGTVGALESGQLAALNTGGGLTASGAGAAGMGGGAGLTGATLGTDAALTGAGTTLGTLAGTGTTLGTGAGLTAGGAGAAGMGGGTGLTSLTGAGLAAGSALTLGSTGIPSMGGGTGLTALSNVGAPAGAPLTAPVNVIPSMGGGTGLTVPAAGGGTVGASGVFDPNISSIPTPVGAPGSTSIDPSILKQLQDATGLTGAQLAALLSGGVNAATALNTSGAIGAGLKAQQDATKASQDVLKGVYDTQLGFQKPYQGTGINALNQMGQLGSGTYQMYDPVTGQPTTMGAGSGYLTHQFDKNDLTSGLAPNYDFMLQQGQMANQRAANVGGGALSGNTLQGLQNYTQNYAGNAYQNAFQNYQTQRNNIYNNLSNMAGIGTDANKQASAAGTSYGTNISNLNVGLGNATAAAMLGQAQAAGGGANSAANALFLASLLNQGVKTPPP